MNLYTVRSNLLVFLHTVTFVMWWTNQKEPHLSYCWTKKMHQHAYCTSSPPHQHPNKEFTASWFRYRRKFIATISFPVSIPTTRSYTRFHPQPWPHNFLLDCWHCSYVRKITVGLCFYLTWSVSFVNVKFHKSYLLYSGPSLWRSLLGTLLRFVSLHLCAEVSTSFSVLF